MGSWNAVRTFNEYKQTAAEEGRIEGRKGLYSSKCFNFAKSPSTSLEHRGKTEKMQERVSFL